MTLSKRPLAIVTGAMLEGKGEVISGWQNKLQAAIASVMPADITAEMHAKIAAPGTAKKTAA